MILKIFVSVFALGTLSTAYTVPYPNGRFRFYDYDISSQNDLNLKKENKEYNENSNSDLELKRSYILSDLKLNWTEAYKSCQDQGMALASPVNRNEPQNLLNYISENDLLPEDPYSGYWIGGRRKNQYDSWKWESIDKNITLFGWLPGEPNDFTGEDCIELKFDFYFMGWNNHYCNELKRYICEKTSALDERTKNSAAGEESNIDNYKETDKKTLYNDEVLNDDRTDDLSSEEFQQTINNVPPQYRHFEEEELEDDKSYDDYATDRKSFEENSDETTDTSSYSDDQTDEGNGNFYPDDNGGIYYSSIWSLDKKFNENSVISKLNEKTSVEDNNQQYVIFKPTSYKTPINRLVVDTEDAEENISKRIIYDFADSLEENSDETVEAAFPSDVKTYTDYGNIDPDYIQYISSY